MVLRLNDCRARLQAFRAYTITEVVFAMAALAVTVGALYAGMTYGMREAVLTRENLRATQVMLEKLEQLRLYPAYKLRSYFDPDDPEDPLDPFDSTDPHVAGEDEPAYTIPTTFEVPYKPGVTNTGDPVYCGRFIISTNTAFGMPYDGDILRVGVEVTWDSGGRTQTRSMETFFAKYGMQINMVKVSK